MCMEKSLEAFRTIGEVAKMLDLPQHVLRFWEVNFKQIKPLKMNGGRRYYRPCDIEIIKLIRTMLYDRGYTIKGAQKVLKEEKIKGEPAIVKEPPVNKEENIQLGIKFNKIIEDKKQYLQKALSELIACKRILDKAKQ